MWVITCNGKVVVDNIDTEIDAINLCRQINTTPGIELGTYKVEWKEDDDGIHPLPN